MSTVIRHGNTCKVTQTSNKRSVDAEVMSFNEGRNLTVVINKSIKVNMSFNGRLYEGRVAGMDFESEGPTINRTQTGIRG